MADESEEKTLPASQKKLRDARRKGKTSNSKDLVVGFSLLAAVLYLLNQWPTMRDRVLALVDEASSSTQQPFAEAWQRVVYGTAEVLVMTTVPLFAVIVVVVLLIGMLATGGPVFSFESVKLQLDHVNPLQGAKRIFATRNLMEFAKSLAKVVVLGAAFWAVLRGIIQPLFEVPACGEACFGPMVISTLRPLAVTAVIAFVVIGVLDMPLQRQLFLKDMKMSVTERKREFKDQEGDPHIKGERRRIRSMMAAKQVRKGVRHAVVVIAHEDRVVGIRYHREDTPVPLVVSKGRGAAADKMLAEARRLGIPVVEDASMVEGLIGRALGDRIPQDFYTPVARLLVRFGI